MQGLKTGTEDFNDSQIYELVITKEIVPKTQESISFEFTLI
jgi:hypothetical protein